MRMYLKKEEVWQNNYCFIHIVSKFIYFIYSLANSEFFNKKVWTCGREVKSVDLSLDDRESFSTAFHLGGYGH